MRPYIISIDYSEAYTCVVMSLRRIWRGVCGALHTPNNSSPSSLWRGITVTSSISHRNAISGGVSPGGRGNAMLATRCREGFGCISKVWHVERERDNDAN
jgi:hypothetical protein